MGRFETAVDTATVLFPPDAATMRAAARTVAGLAHDAADALDLLTALGIPKEAMR